MRTLNPENDGPKPHCLKFRQLLGPYAIVRLAPDAPIPNWATRGDFTSITRTADELSIVCPAANLPQDVDPGPRWICLKLEGPFPFSQTGVLLSFIKPLSNNGVPIFAISTYDTDYVLVQEEYIGGVPDLLHEACHELISGDDEASRKMIAQRDCDVGSGTWFRHLGQSWHWTCAVHHSAQNFSRTL